MKCNIPKFNMQSKINGNNIVWYLLQSEYEFKQQEVEVSPPLPSFQVASWRVCASQPHTPRLCQSRDSQRQNISPQGHRNIPIYL